MSKIHIVVQYRKVTNPNLPVAKYHLHGHKDKKGNKIVTGALVKVDPIIKDRGNSNLKRVILKHESDEIYSRAKGHGLRESHRLAESKEPSWFSKKFRTHSQLQRILRSN